MQQLLKFGRLRGVNAMGKPSRRGASRGAAATPPQRPPPPFSSPFADAGRQGPCLVPSKRAGGVPLLCGLCCWALFMLGTLLALGGPRLGTQLLCHWTWTLVSLFSAVAVFGRWVGDGHVVGCISFWCLFALHGLTWLQLLLIWRDGVGPSELWSALGEYGGAHVLFSQFGSLALLALPPLSLLGYMYVDRDYLLIIHHDFHSQLLPHHRKWNLAWQIFSPAVPLATWAYLLRPPLFSDLPRWPGVGAVLGICLLCNGPLVIYAIRRNRHYVGPVHWLPGGGGSLVWSVPLAH